MATLTVRNGVIRRLKDAAGLNGRSMEQEVRELLSQRYQARDEILARIRDRWNRFPAPQASQVDEWIETGRK